MIVSGIEVPVWLFASGFLLLSTLLMLLLKSLILRAVQRWVDRSSFRFDTLLLSSVSFPLNLIILVLNLTFVVYHTFDNFSINFTVMLRAKEYFNRFWVKSAFIKALHQRYREEGIVIPFPITAVNFSQEHGASPRDADLRYASDNGARG